MFENSLKIAKLKIENYALSVSRLLGANPKNTESREKSTPEIRDMGAKTKREMENETAALADGGFRPGDSTSSESGFVSPVAIVENESVILNLVDKLMGAGESIHTVALTWGALMPCLPKDWCVRRRQQRLRDCQAVSSVAPSVRQHVHLASFYA